MQLKLRRSQRDSGIVSKTVVFCLDARVQLTPGEQASVSRYKLGSQVIYNNEASKRRVQAAEAAMATGTNGGSFKAIAHLALARLHLNITVDSLQRGQHIECKSLEELLEAEDALMEACKTLRTYLDTAATFDGREVLVDFSSAEPVVVSTAPPPALVAPQTYTASPPDPAISSAPDPTPAYEEPPASGEAWSPAPSDPDVVGAWLSDWLAGLGRYWRAASPEKQVLVIALGVLVLVILYEAL